MLADFTQLKAIVTGATNQIGHFLVPQLATAGFTEVIAYSRRPHLSESSVHWQQIDLHATAPMINQPTVLFHLAPLTLLTPLLNCLSPLTPLKRVIAFSSTSRLSKIDSLDAKEREIAMQLATAEQVVMTHCQQHNIPCTVFRPTLIYGCGQDKNISFITQFIRRFGFFPILGTGAGLRQPVHAEDLAIACLKVCSVPETYYQVYNLSGGQTLSYREMVETIFYQLNKKPRIITIPNVVFNGVLQAIRWLPNYAHLSTAMIKRMNEDLYFDHVSATQDFDYQPRRFSEHDLGI
jgi:nucleoside-diphosphate-sugar epimerase